jgi:hypothetical protein
LHGSLFGKPCIWWIVVFSSSHVGPTFLPYLQLLVAPVIAADGRSYDEAAWTAAAQAATHKVI